MRHPPGGQSTLIRIRAGQVTLEGDLHLPRDPAGVVLFAHGSGSSRHSRRNRQVAAVLQSAGLATLLIDLLTAEEEGVDRQTAHLRFDIPLLAGRVVAATRWLAEDSQTSLLSIGCFGASTGAAAALVAAAQVSGRVGAVVSRGGRPDLAGNALSRVIAPALFVVGERDLEVLELNRIAMAQMGTVTRLEIVPGATHLFEEPGALERVAQLARDWFLHYLAEAARPG